MAAEIPSTEIPSVSNTKVPDSKMQPTVTIQETNTPIHIKLDGTNYRIWSKVLEMHIAGRKDISQEGRLHPQRVTRAMMNGKLKMHLLSLGLSIP